MGAKSKYEGAGKNCPHVDNLMGPLTSGKRKA